ncbi:MAG: hypothetical protein JWP57_1049 [Spirosoma sp.]|nr:hypothetical protein [Spirosoma sp.]
MVVGYSHVKARFGIKNRPSNQDGTRPGESGSGIQVACLDTDPIDVWTYRRRCMEEYRYEKIMYLQILVFTSYFSMGIIIKSNLPLWYYAFSVDIHSVDSCVLAEH